MVRLQPKSALCAAGRRAAKRRGERWWLHVNEGDSERSNTAREKEANLQRVQVSLPLGTVVLRYCRRLGATSGASDEGLPIIVAAAEGGDGRKQVSLKKADSLTTPSPVTRQLALLMSRCTMRFAWRYSRPDRICPAPAEGGKKGWDIMVWHRKHREMRCTMDEVREPPKPNEDIWFWAGHKVIGGWKDTQPSGAS